MRLYEINASTNRVPLKPVRIFVGAKAEGVAERKLLAEMGFKRNEISEVEVEVPTDKQGLLTFLNSLAL